MTHKSPSGWGVIGFTGSRRGITDAQAGILRVLLVNVYEFHHGDCVGADEAAHDIARESGCCRIVGHPCKYEGMRAFTACDEVLPPKAPLQRNHDIVDVAERMVACPNTESEVWRSGTWATIRYAKKQHRPLVIVFPNGGTGETDAYL